jgi:hypothetical protein
LFHVSAFSGAAHLLSVALSVCSSFGLQGGQQSLPASLLISLEASCLLARLLHNHVALQVVWRSSCMSHISCLALLLQFSSVLCSGQLI